MLFRPQNIGYSPDMRFEEILGCTRGKGFVSVDYSGPHVLFSSQRWDPLYYLCLCCGWWAGVAVPLNDFNGRARLSATRMGECPSRSWLRAYLRGCEAIVKIAWKLGWTYVFFRFHGCNDRCSNSRVLLRCACPSATCLARILHCTRCCLCARCIARSPAISFSVLVLRLDQ